MSESDVANVVTEKLVLKEFLELYRNYPCLWDQTHRYYANREARDRAYEVLLEKYKLVQDDATILDVKKKIEYMRCAYRREHKKVIVANLRGKKHKPVLWYYDLLTFLNDNSNFKVSEPVVTHFEDSYEETEEINDDSDDSTPLKKIKMNSSKTVYVSEELNNEEVAVRDDLYVTDHLEQDQTQSFIVSNEPEAFGRTIGYQLKELHHMQRVFAEKIISDVIYHGRLGNLSSETILSLNND